MIQYLGETLKGFPGPANQTRCFVHTINLIAKSILKPFETQKPKDIQVFNGIAQAIAGVTEGTEEATGDEKDDASGEGDGEEEQADDEKDQDADEHEGALDNELSTSLDPIRTTLLKVCIHFTDLDYNPTLINIGYSYGKLHSHSKIQQPSFCQHGRRYSHVMTFPIA